MGSSSRVSGDRGDHAHPVASYPSWALRPHHLTAITLLWKLSPGEACFNPSLPPVWSQFIPSSYAWQYRSVYPTQLLTLHPRSRDDASQSECALRPPTVGPPFSCRTKPPPFSLPTAPSETGPSRSAVPDSEGYFNGCITLNEPSTICSTP